MMKCRKSQYVRFTVIHPKRHILVQTAPAKKNIDIVSNSLIGYTQQCTYKNYFLGWYHTTNIKLFFTARA